MHKYGRSITTNEAFVARSLLLDSSSPFKRAHSQSVQLNRESCERDKFAVEFPRRAFPIDSACCDTRPFPRFLDFPDFPSFSFTGASERETSRLNRRSYRPEKIDQREIRIVHANVNRRGNIGISLGVSMRLSEKTSHSSIRIAGSTQLFDFHQNAFSKITVSFIKDSRCIIRLRFQKQKKKSWRK